MKPLKLSHPKVVNIGSRTSQLALKQTNIIADMIRTESPDITVNIITMETIGDKILDVALAKIGDKSLFTKELEIALDQKQVDLVVHSFKDMPTILPPGLVVGAVCCRECPADAVLMAPRYRGRNLASLPPGSVVGTSAVRRIAQLKRRYPHLSFASVRGNLNTRLRKLDQPEAFGLDQGSGEYAALILAKAGLERLGWEQRIDEVRGD